MPSCCLQHLGTYRSSLGNYRKTELPLLQLLHKLVQRMVVTPNSKRKKLPLLLRIRQLLGVLLRALRLMLLLLVKLHQRTPLLKILVQPLVQLLQLKKILTRAMSSMIIDV